MSGNKCCVARKIETGFALQHPHRGERHRHQRRLRILGERERFRGSFEDDAVNFAPSAKSTSSNTARAAAKFAARALPIPTVWLPCPGNTKAIAMASVNFAFSSKSSRETPAIGPPVKLRGTGNQAQRLWD